MLLWCSTCRAARQFIFMWRNICINFSLGLLLPHGCRCKAAWWKWHMSAETFKCNRVEEREERRKPPQLQSQDKKFTSKHDWQHCAAAGAEQLRHASLAFRHTETTTGNSWTVALSSSTGAILTAPPKLIIMQAKHEMHACCFENLGSLRENGARNKVRSH